MMTKYWIPGQVNTRIAQDCSNQVAADTHRSLTIYLTQVLAFIHRAPHLLTSPDEHCPAMRLAVGNAQEVGP